MAQAYLEESPETETPRHMTWEEFLYWDFESMRWEWIDGEVIEFPYITAQHNFLTGFLLSLLMLYVSKFDAGRLFGSFLMRLAERPSGRVPDTLFLAKENLHRLQDRFVDGPADLVVEVTSEESDYRDRVEKFVEYERGGVQDYWILDYRKQETLFYQLDAKGRYQRVLADDTGRYYSAIMPGFWINVNWLWQEPKPLIEAMRALNIIPTV